MNIVYNFVNSLVENEEEGLPPVHMESRRPNFGKAEKSEFWDELRCTPLAFMLIGCMAIKDAYSSLFGCGNYDR